MYLYSNYVYTIWPGYTHAYGFECQVSGTSIFKKIKFRYMAGYCTTAPVILSLSWNVLQFKLTEMDPSELADRLKGVMRAIAVHG